MERFNIFGIKKSKILQLIVIFYFILYFIVGICVYKDYGFSTDESAEWEESIVAYKYINSKIFHREVPELSKVQTWKRLIIDIMAQQCRCRWYLLKTCLILH